MTVILVMLNGGTILSTPIQNIHKKYFKQAKAPLYCLFKNSGRTGWEFIIKDNKHAGSF